MFWRKKRPLSDFAQEIQSHLAHEADQIQEHGNARTEADAAARRAFGNVGLVEEHFYRQGRLAAPVFRGAHAPSRAVVGASPTTFF